MPDAALALVARAAEGSMRDAQSALDQVMAFAGTTITVEDVSTVLGLVGRDLLFDLIEAVADEDGPRAFALADRAVESGHDLKLVIRDLARVVRDVMILSVDPARAGDGELAEGELERLKQLSGRFSREDLLRAFDVLAKAEQDLRVAAHPRYHFEMALLRWMHLRKLVPLADVLEQFGAGSGGWWSHRRARVAPAPRAPHRHRVPQRRHVPRPVRSEHPRRRAPRRRIPRQRRQAPSAGAAPGSLKDALLAEIRAAKAFFYNTVVAQAQSIDDLGRQGGLHLPADASHAARAVRADAPVDRSRRRAHRRPEGVGRVPAGRAGAAGPAAPASAPPTPDGAGFVAQRQEGPEGRGDGAPAVQAVLEVFPAEIKDVEEL